MIWSMAQADSVVPKSCPPSSAVKIVGQVMALPGEVGAVTG